jgi:hypothetical protein
MESGIIARSCRDSRRCRLSRTKPHGRNPRRYVSVVQSFESSQFTGPVRHPVGGRTRRPCTHVAVADNRSGEQAGRWSAGVGRAGVVVVGADGASRRAGAAPQVSNPLHALLSEQSASGATDMMFRHHSVAKARYHLVIDDEQVQLPFGLMPLKTLGPTRPRGRSRAGRGPVPVGRCGGARTRLRRGGRRPGASVHAHDVVAVPTSDMMMAFWLRRPDQPATSTSLGRLAEPVQLDRAERRAGAGPDRDRGRIGIGRRPLKPRPGPESVAGVADVREARRRVVQVSLASSK